MIEEAVKNERRLKVEDRCDRCGAQAFVIVSGVNGELYFCGHHFAQHEEALSSYAYEIVDEREFI